MNQRFAILGLAAVLAGCAGLPPKPKPVVLPNEAPLAGLEVQGGAASEYRIAVLHQWRAQVCQRQSGLFGDNVPGGAA